MAKVKYDAVLQAVHYQPDGQVEWVRTFQRRGPTWSDYVLLDRTSLVADLKAGKKYMIGTRVPYMASTFEVSEPLQLVQDSGNEFLVVGEKDAQRDHLEGVPVI